MKIPNLYLHRYAAVKRVCCVERPVASQVINFKTISNEKKVPRFLFAETRIPFFR